MSTVGFFFFLNTCGAVDTWEEKVKEGFSWEVSFSPNDAEELYWLGWEVGDGGRSGQARSMMYARSSGLGQTLGDSERQGSLACCSLWGRKESGTT